MKRNIYLFITFAIAGILAFFGGNSMTPDTQFGLALPQTPALFETSLASPITSTATSMTLTANSVRGGGTLSGYNCFTIDEGSAQAEFVCGTVSSTSVTSLTRGINPLNATTTVASLQFSHRRGSNVKITDFPIIQLLKAQANGEDTYANPLLYTSGTGCSSGSASTTLCDKYYIDNLANQGSATSTESLGGLVQLSTQLQMASSTDLGADTPLVLQAKYATSSPGYAGLWSVITNNAGKIAQGFLDLTQSFTFSGGLTSTGTTTLATTTVNGVNIKTTFGGTGSDGALTVTSGTTNIDLGGASVFTKNYSSIEISGTGAITFSNPASTGTLIRLLSQGDVTITSSATPAIDVKGIGSTSGTAPDFIFDSTDHRGGTGTNGAIGSGGTAGSAGSIWDNSTINWFFTNTAEKLVRQGYGRYMIPGSGGSAGGTGTGGGSAGSGGRGGGALYMEIAGALNITGEVDISGSAGTAGANATGSGSGNGGGGGGGVGHFLALYNTLTADSSTITALGGAGGAGGAGGGSDGSSHVGGGGGGSAGQLVAGKAGGAGVSGSAGSAGSAGGAGTGGGGGAGGGLDGGGPEAGGAGGSAGTQQNGSFLIAKNVWFN